MAAAVAVLVVVAAGSFFIKTRILAPRGPEESFLKASLAAELPPYVRVDHFQIETSQNSGDRVQPVFLTRFLATLEFTADTFAQSSAEDGAVFIVSQAKQGAIREIHGLATSQLVGVTWNVSLALDNNPVSTLGQPRESFKANRVIVRGSPDESAFREEQRQRRDEEHRRIQGLRTQQAAAEQRRLEETLRTAERAKAEADDAERRRAAAVREADTRNAQIGNERRRQDAQRTVPDSPTRQRQPDESAFVGELPAGAEMNVRLLTAIDSGTTSVEDRFQAALVEDFKISGRTLVPAGSVLRGIVSSVQPATRTNRTARITLSFDLLTIGGRSYPIRGRVTKVIEGAGLKGEAARVGTGAGVGAVLGGIFGGVKGAIAGLLIGGGGTIAATDGKQVELKTGSVVRMKIESRVQITAEAR